MGFGSWFSQSQSEADKRATEVRAGTVAPTRAERLRCWEARDGYFACLDANNIVDALKEDKRAAKVCGKESAQFENDCATQWVRLSFKHSVPVCRCADDLSSCPRSHISRSGGYKTRKRRRG